MFNRGGTDCCSYIIKQVAGRGPAICDLDGFVLSSSALFWTVFEEIYYDEDPDIFPKAVSSIKDIREMINIFRTLCHSSNSHVMNRRKVRHPDIDIVKH